MSNVAHSMYSNYNKGERPDAKSGGVRLGKRLANRTAAITAP